MGNKDDFIRDTIRDEVRDMALDLLKIILNDDFRSGRPVIEGFVRGLVDAVIEITPPNGRAQNMDVVARAMMDAIRGEMK